MGDDRKITIAVKVDGVSYDCPLDEFFGDMKGHVAALVAKAKMREADRREAPAEG